MSNALKTALHAIDQDHSLIAMPYRAAADLIGIAQSTMRYAIKAAKKSYLSHAIEEEVFKDGRVIDALSKMGDVAARACLGVEHRLGRTLTRSRAEKLAEAFVRISQQRLQAEARTKVETDLRNNYPAVVCFIDDYRLKKAA